jgi:transposase-like protein
MDTTDSKSEESKLPAKKKRPRKTWGDEDKIAGIAALEANNGNLILTSQQLGIPTSTLHMWSKTHKAGKLIPTNGPLKPDPEAVAKANEEFRRRLDEKLEALVHQLLDAAPGKIEKANLRDTMVAVGIGIEKMKLLRGEPTAITQREENVKQLSDSQLADMLTLARKVAIELAPRPVQIDQSEVMNGERGTGTVAGTDGLLPTDGVTRSPVAGEGISEAGSGT